MKPSPRSSFASEAAVVLCVLEETEVQVVEEMECAKKSEECASSRVKDMAHDTYSSSSYPLGPYPNIDVAQGEYGGIRSLFETVHTGARHSTMINWMRLVDALQMASVVTVLAQALPASPNSVA